MVYHLKNIFVLKFYLQTQKTRFKKKKVKTFLSWTKSSPKRNHLWNKIFSETKSSAALSEGVDSHVEDPPDNILYSNMFALHFLWEQKRSPEYAIFFNFRMKRSFLSRLAALIAVRKVVVSFSDMNEMGMTKDGLIRASLYIL